MNKIETFQPTAQSPELVRIHNELFDRGFAITNDEALGLPSDLPEHLQEVFYKDSILGPEKEEVPPHNRIRARDVVEYQRRAGGIALAEFITNAVPSNTDISYDRTYNRAYALEDELQARWIGKVLSMVPLPHRDVHGTIGLNYTRTFDEVVGWAHQDGSVYTAIYVIGKHNTRGGTTILHPRNRNDLTQFDTHMIRKSVTLEPGEYLVFDDRMFKHNVTHLEGDSTKHRDTLLGLIQPSINYNIDQYTFPAFNQVDS